MVYRLDALTVRCESLGSGARHMLLWYVWIRLVDGAWHRLDDIARQLHLPRNAVGWAARYMSDNGLVELGEEEEIRIGKTHLRFEEVVRNLPKVPAVR